MNTFNINRVGALLRYDWTLSKQSLKHTLVIISGIYISLVLLTFFTKYEVGMVNIDTTGVPEAIAVLCYTFFSYANIAAILVVTTLLTQKFCYSRTATAYLTLPGTSLEKFVTMMIDYLVVFLGVKVLYVVMFYLTMGLCSLYAPELDWAQNALAMDSQLFRFDEVHTKLTEAFDGDKIGDTTLSQSFANDLASTISTLLWTTPFWSLISFAYYLILCMFFRTNVQVKAIATYVATNMMLTILLIITAIIFIANAEPDTWTGKEVFNFATTLMATVRYTSYATPLIAGGMLYFLYNQMSHKQAK